MEILSENFIRHDKYQLETIFIYPFQKENKKNIYQIDTYFFLPENLGIHSDSYPKSLFFSDFHQYIRFKTPVMRYEKIFSAVNSPYDKLSQAIGKLPDSSDYYDDYQNKLKMFCSIVKSTMRDETDFLIASLKTEQFQYILEYNLKQIQYILEQFRLLKQEIHTAKISDLARQIFWYADEFLSLNTCRNLETLYDNIENEELRKTLTGLIDEEITYRKKQQYPSIPHKNTDNSGLIYRESALKKIMASVLFLHTIRRRDGALVENILLGCAAGLAMIFATGIAFLYKGMFLEDFSLAFFTILVISYMFKDRIKELLRCYFQQNMRRFIADYKIAITNQQKAKIGMFKESMSFISESRLDREIKKYRGRTHLGIFENNQYQEQIIHYRKQIEIFSHPVDLFFKDFDISGVVDIMRFNVRNFLKKMDNPNRVIAIPGKNKKLEKIRARKIYHVNVIMKWGQKGRKSEYRHFRLYLSRNGLQKIEVINFL